MLVGFLLCNFNSGCFFNFGSPFNSRVRLTLSIVGENRIVVKQKDWSPIVFAQGWISFLKVPMAGVCTMEFEFPLNMGTASMKVLYRIASIYGNVYRKVYENKLDGFLWCNFNSGCFFNCRKSIHFSGSINFVHRWWESKSTSSPGLFARSWRVFAMSFETFSLVGNFKLIRSFAVYLSDDCHCSFNNGWQVLSRQFSVNLYLSLNGSTQGPYPEKKNRVLFCRTFAWDSKFPAMPFEGRLTKYLIDRLTK